MAHAVWQAKDYISNEYIAILLPDDIIVAQEPGLQQLISIAQKMGGSVIAIQEVPMEKVSSYGVVSIKNKLSDDVFEISDIVEKPNKEDAPF